MTDSTTGDVSSPPSSESSASEASRLLTEQDAAPEQDFRVRFIPSDERTAREQAFNGGNYPQAEHWRLLRLALSEIDCLREDGQALVESNREARRLALERYEGLLAAEAALVARDAELAEARREVVVYREQRDRDVAFLLGKAAALKAEVTQLRAALEEIAAKQPATVAMFRTRTVAENPRLKGGTETSRHTGFGDCACDACYPPERSYPLANHGKPVGLLRSLWIVLRGVQFYV